MFHVKRWPAFGYRPDGSTDRRPRILVREVQLAFCGYGRRIDDFHGGGDRVEAASHVKGLQPKSQAALRIKLLKPSFNIDGDTFAG